jgi:uncharacterized protein YbjQ (UPF0145 family)
MSILIVNTETVPGTETVAVLGLVRGTVIQAKHLGKDRAAGFSNAGRR